MLKEIIAEKQCFLDKDTSSITSLFGAPRPGNRRVIKYNISKYCQGGDEYMTADELQFYRDTNKITDVRFGRN